MRKAFTLIEMVVALGILAVVLSFAGVIFRVRIESQRLAVVCEPVYRAFDFVGLIWMRPCDNADSR